ncbi:MAG: squalene/phytoene synthase family protein [Hyphomicrobiaceae bacterium]
MAAAPPEASKNVASLAELREVAIVREPDRYLAATLAPAGRRYDLVVLAAFAAEITRVPGQVREPLAGEIRLQWWRDALIGGSADAAAGHPVAMAMRATIARFELPGLAVEGVIDAQADILHGERPVDEVALRARMSAGEGGLFRLAARICAAAADDDTNNDAPTADLAGLAYGLSRALSRAPTDDTARLLIPHSLASDADLAAGDDASARATLGRLALAAHADVAARMRQMSRRQRLAFLPLVMVRPNLRALQRETAKKGPRPGDALPIARLLRIAWAHMSGRV